MAVQSRRVSSSSLSDCESQSARFLTPQPLVEDNRCDLPALAASGAVAQHPAAPEAHRRGQRLVVDSTIVFVIGAGIEGRHHRLRSSRSTRCTVSQPEPMR